MRDGAASSTWFEIMTSAKDAHEAKSELFDDRDGITPPNDNDEILDPLQ
jgi:hypothetical protein